MKSVNEIYKSHIKVGTTCLKHNTLQKGRELALDKICSKIGGFFPPAMLKKFAYSAQYSAQGN